MITKMIDIQVEQLVEWVEKKYEQKYGDRLELLKKTFFSFYNLTRQIIDIYNDMLQECRNSTQIGEDRDRNKQQLESLKIVVNRTSIILHKLIQNQELINNRPGSLNMLFCQKFIKNFGENLNVLCTYYHSLNHYQFVTNRFRCEKKKIVQGINKLYTIHNKIRQLYYKNDEDLKNIQNHKLYFNINIKNILKERQLLIKYNKNLYPFVEDQISDFYQNYLQFIKSNKSTAANEQNTNNTDPAEQTIKKLMRSYFRILQQFYESQAELQYYIKPINQFCEQIKNKKKPINYSIIESVNTFTRISSQLLKMNYSLKNIKKIRIQDYSKSLHVILDQILLNNNLVEIKQSAQLYGHRIYKLFGIGLYARQQNQNENRKDKERLDKERQNYKNKQKYDKYKSKPKQKVKSRENDKKSSGNINQNYTNATNNSNGNSVNNSNDRQKARVNTSGRGKGSSKIKIQLEQYKLSRKQISGKQKIKLEAQMKAQEQNNRADDHQQSDQSELIITQSKDTQQFRSQTHKNKNRQKLRESSKDKQRQKHKQKGKQRQKSKTKNKENQKKNEQQEDERQQEHQLQASSAWERQSNHKPQYEYECETVQQKIQLVVDQICQCSIFIMDCLKQLEKVQSSGLLSMIQEYKQKLYMSPIAPTPNASSANTVSNSTNTSSANSQTPGSRKLIGALCQYQKYICLYYRVSENIKQFENVARQIVLRQFNIKINIIIDMQPRQSSKHSGNSHEGNPPNNKQGQKNNKSDSNQLKNKRKQ